MIGHIQKNSFTLHWLELLSSEYLLSSISPFSINKILDKNKENLHISISYWQIALPSHSQLSMVPQICFCVSYGYRKRNHVEWNLFWKCSRKELLNKYKIDRLCYLCRSWIGLSLSYYIIYIIHSKYTNPTICLVGLGRNREGEREGQRDLADSWEGWLSLGLLSCAYLSIIWARAVYDLDYVHADQQLLS